MADETVQTTEQTTLETPSRVETRIKELSDKVELTGKERDELKTLNTQAEAKAQAAEKERDFYMQFSDVVASNPKAKEFKTDILSKVQAGYTVEDATLAVLAKAGQLNTAPAVERVMPAGGSAPIAITADGGKTITDMSRDEKRQALMDAEKRGDISLS